MENTCVETKCWFYRLIKEFGNKDEVFDFKDCPFYSEMIFTPTPVGGVVSEAKLVKDCVNKRSLLVLLQEVFPRVLGMQASNEEMRNVTELAKEKLIELMGTINVVNVINEVKEIESTKVRMVEVIEDKTLLNEGDSSARE